MKLQAVIVMMQPILVNREFRPENIAPWLPEHAHAVNNAMEKSGDAFASFDELELYHPLNRRDLIIMGGQAFYGS
jgi:hypothetical protein